MNDFIDLCCRAIDHIKNLDQKDLLQTEEDNVQKYTIVSRVIPSETMAKFKEQLKTDGQAPCCFEGCGVVNSSIIWVSRHYYSCPHAPPEVTGDTYQCTKCDAIFKKKSDIETHVNKHDWAEQYASDTDDSADSDVSDDDMSSGETESDTELPEPNSIKKTGDLRKRKPKPKSAETAGYPTRQLLALSGYSDGHIFPSSFPWTLAWRKKLLSTDVMPEWRPKSDDWTLVDNVAPCLPVSQLSPSFRVVQKQKTKVATTRLALFDAVLYGGATFNVGGPIWAAAWCPVPVTMATSHQYLAVYCHRHHDVTHVVERGLDKSKALLQIWDCGTLQEGTISEKPRLYLAVAADYGAIWGLAWCPNGAWDSPDVELQNGHFPRLGLLALACADGMTHILSIPQPSCPLTDRHPVGKLPVYTVRPCLNLKPTYSPDEVGSQCLCVDWIYEDGRSLIVAGFADGTVALWDLHSRLSLLYTSSPTEGATLRPFENFAAHTAQTTGVKFCPQNRQFLGTCSHDRTMKMWDTNDLQCPINKTICSQMTSLVWPPHWSLVYASGDDCYCFGHNAVHVIDNGYYGLNVRPMTIHNSCIWDVSSCDWVNAVSSVSAVGEVAGIWLPEMVYSYRRLKGFTTRRFFIFQTTLEEHTDNDHHKGTPQSLKEHAGRESTSVGHDGVNVEMIRCEGSNSKGDDLRTEVMNHSCDKQTVTGGKDCNYCLVYSDLDMAHILEKSQERMSFARDMPRDSLDQPPLLAIHKVCWNPNLGCHLWLAAGGHAGLVRLRHISGLHTKKTSRLMKEFKCNT
ncbi:hypothetical protein LSAT2_023822 [Lamellibrachia satsuma]|nr:hypothetical protein LSAT2_023822 [Lamellibrachia satsuma]